MIADAYEARARRRAQGATTAPLPPDAALSDRRRVERARWPGAPTRRFSPFQRGRGRAVIDMGAQAGPQLRRRAGAGQRQPVRGRRRPRRDAGGGGQAGAVRLLVRGLVRAAGRHAGRPRPEERRFARATGPRPRRPIRRRRSACVLPLEPASRPTTWRSSPRPTSWATGWRGRAASAAPSNFLAEASALTPGDLVVHIDHGIGRYEGLKTLDVQGAPHDCLELHYGGEAKLYLPVENIDLLTRYGAETRGRAARPAGRRGLAGAQGQGQGAAARDGRGPDRASPPSAPLQDRPRRSTRRTACSTSSAPASPTRRPTTSSTPSATCWRTWRPASRWTG